ncbi:Origin recognition complex subunit 4 [Stylophora pistillata]|uniref:Origin recognition complex subunit 4 n=1 Tax=Stylophora pistillata TaxID=50429 RepID=A0A2B4SVI4_STYPI|nr:Origin recognition complex subunit 4 [Stylophora pistillata]
MKKSRSQSKRGICNPDPRVISEVQSVLRGRIFHAGVPPQLHGLEEQNRELLDLIQRCAQYGESNSVLLIGPRGSGKSLLVKKILEDLSKTKGVKQNLLEVHLNGISVLELCLIIAMKHLVTLSEGDPFNFEMVYQEYQKFAQKKGLSIQSFEKPVVLKAFEHLTALEFVNSIDNIAKNTPKEYRLVTLLVDPTQINSALQRYPDCPTEVKQWATSAIV